MVIGGRGGGVGDMGAGVIRGLERGRGWGISFGGRERLGRGVLTRRVRSVARWSILGD